jgi:hypothetical protein
LDCDNFNELPDERGKYSADWMADFGTMVACCMVGEMEG